MMQFVHFWHCFLYAGHDSLSAQCNIHNDGGCSVLDRTASASKTSLSCDATTLTESDPTVHRLHLHWPLHADGVMVTLQASMASLKLSFFYCSRRRCIGSSLILMTIRSRISESSSCSNWHVLAIFQRSPRKSANHSPDCWTRWWKT